MKLIRRTVFDIIDGPTLKGNGPHAGEFVPAQIRFSFPYGIGSSWYGITPHGERFLAEDLDDASVPLWEAVVSEAKRMNTP